jgi:hypothetical protein
VRAFNAPFKVLIIADPRGDLDACYREGLAIKNFLDRRRDIFQVDFKSQPADIPFAKKNIRDYDIVHYAGHAFYDSKNPAESGWVLSDGTLKAGEIAAMGGFQPMPALLFCNACQSGRTEPWKNHDEIFGLANAFLLAGVQHYIGTFWGVADEAGLGFAKYFYQCLAKGEAVGPALRTARRALASDADGAQNLTWANYMLYGEPGISFGAEKPVDGPFDERRGWRRALGNKIARPNNIVVSLLAVVLIVSLYAGYSVFSRYSQQPATTSPEFISNSKVPVPMSKESIVSPLSMTMNMIGLKKEPDGDYSEVIVREGSVLRSGDHFQVHVETSRPCHVYVLIFDSHGQASQLFPDPKIETPGFIERGGRIAVPDKNSWFWLDDHPGIETIYTLASVEPMPHMPKLLSKMAQAAGTARENVPGEINRQIHIVERGVGGVANSKGVSFSQSGTTQLERVKKVTEVVGSTGAVVRAVSFEHR